MTKPEEPIVEQFADKVKQQLSEYIELRSDLLKANAVDKIAKASSKLFTSLVVMVLLFFVVLFTSLVAGFYFGALLGSLMKGFGLVALIYFTILLLVLLFKKQFIQTPIANAVIKIMYEDDEA